MARSATKLLQRMRLSKADWGADDLDRLYVGFGFDKIEGSKHTVYIHAEWQDLRATVGRHSPLAFGYVTHAIKTIDEAERRQETKPK